MPSPETKRLPSWAERERLSDLGWIRENWHVFWPAAERCFKELGRGALVIETTVRVVHPDGESNPFWYLTQKQVEASGDPDARRMVREYDPSWELVAILLKSERRVSIYRVGMPGYRTKERR